MKRYRLRLYVNLKRFGLFNYRPCIHARDVTEEDRPVAEDLIHKFNRTFGNVIEYDFKAT